MRNDSEFEELSRVVPLVHAVTSRIAITNITSSNNPEVLRAEGFTPESILCLSPESQKRFGSDGREMVALVDGANDDTTFARAVNTLQRMLEMHPRVLVHCHAGRSRSVAVVAAYMTHHTGISPEAALAYCISRRPCASVMPGLVHNLRVFAASSENQAYRDS